MRTPTFRLPDSVASPSTPRRRARANAILAAAALAAAVACSPDEILDAGHPDIVDPAQLNSASAAPALRVGVTQRIAQSTTGLAPTGGATGTVQIMGNESLALLGGLLADEYRSGDTFE